MASTRNQASVEYEMVDYSEDKLIYCPDHVNSIRPRWDKYLLMSSLAWLLKSML